MTTINKVTTKTTEGTTETKFPKEFSNIVYLRRKPINTVLPGQNMDEAKIKIGSGYKGTSILRGLTFEEEIKFLPNIMGINASSPNWELETKNYWNNISREVPPKEGLQLEVGLFYKSKEDYEADLNKPKNINGVIENPNGTPINIGDYILWRFCLVYSRVANTVEDLGKSPKIEFYLFSKEKEIRDKKSTIETLRKANNILNQRISERDWVDYMLRVLIAGDKETKYTIRDIGSVGEDEKDVMIYEFLQKNPDRFLGLAVDKSLEMKAFVELAIAMNILTRIPNTTAVSLDSETIGHTMEEVIAYLENPKNAPVLTTLRAQVKMTP